MQLQIKFSDRIRCEQGVPAALLDQMSIAFGLDLSVDDNESDVYASARSARFVCPGVQCGGMMRVLFIAMAVVGLIGFA
jgi:hypothetical protein